MPYKPDLRDESWAGVPEHRGAKPYDPELTRDFNDHHRQEELAKAEKSRQEEAARAAKGTAS